MTTSMNRRTLLAAGAALAGLRAAGVSAQAQPTIRFAAVFSERTYAPR